MMLKVSESLDARSLVALSVTRKEVQSNLAVSVEQRVKQHALWWLGTNSEFVFSEALKDVETPPLVWGMKMAAMSGGKEGSYLMLDSTLLARRLPARDSYEGVRLADYMSLISADEAAVHYAAPQEWHGLSLATYPDSHKAWLAKTVLEVVGNGPDGSTDSRFAALHSLLKTMSGCDACSTDEVLLAAEFVRADWGFWIYDFTNEDRQLVREVEEVTLEDGCLKSGEVGYVEQGVRLLREISGSVRTWYDDLCILCRMVDTHLDNLEFMEWEDGQRERFLRFLEVRYGVEDV